MADIGNVYLSPSSRYGSMAYNRVSRSGLKFPAVSLGFWHNSGSNGDYDTMRTLCRKAFDHDRTHMR